MKEYLTQHNVLLAVGVLLILAIGVFGYLQYTKKTNYVDNKEFSEDASAGQKRPPIDVYFFTVEWCPHCKKALPVWDSLTTEMPSVNGRPVRYHKVDCDDKPQMADKFEVSSYPTIKLVSQKQTVEYDAKPELATLKQFIRTAA